MEKEAEHYLTQALNLMDPKDFEDNIGGLREMGGDGKLPDYH